MSSEIETTPKEDNGFHGFETPTAALNYYYENVLGGRHPEGFEYNQEKKLLEWLANRPKNQ